MSAKLVFEKKKKNWRLDGGTLPVVVLRLELLLLFLVGCRCEDADGSDVLLQSSRGR
jgi:hypothetical protein